MAINRLKTWLRACDEMLFPSPPPCPFCQENLASATGLCESCLASLAINWRKDQIHGYPYFSLFPYQGQGRELLHQMKFLGGYELAAAFGHLLGLAVQEEPELKNLDLIMPIPLHPARFRLRGFNQAAVLADKISKQCNLPVSTNLIRVRDTSPQSGLAKKERQRNLKNAFSLLPGEKLAGRICLIVDDVITSGYTFSTAARLLEQFGAKPCGVFVARTEIWEE